MEENKKEKEQIVDTEEVYVYKITISNDDEDEVIILESPTLYNKEDFKDIVKKYRYKDKKKKEKRSPKKIIKQLIKNEDFSYYEEVYTDEFKIK